jgi:hypothetical protein
MEHQFTLYLSTVKESDCKSMLGRVKDGIAKIRWPMFRRQTQSRTYEDTQLNKNSVPRVRINPVFLPVLSLSRKRKYESLYLYSASSLDLLLHEYIHKDTRKVHSMSSVSLSQTSVILKKREWKGKSVLSLSPFFRSTCRVDWLLILLITFFLSSHRQLRI